MKKYYWTLESWGDQDPPENADEIIEIANAAIDRFIDDNPDADDDMIAAFSEQLWNEYCTIGWDREFATIQTDIGTMTIRYHGPGVPLTAEQGDLVEELEFTPYNYDNATDGVHCMYSYSGWDLEWISE